VGGGCLAQALDLSREIVVGLPDHAHGGPQFLVGGAHPRHLGFHPPLTCGQRFPMALHVVQRAQGGSGGFVQRVHELDDG
jgi:hypothetical protein